MEIMWNELSESVRVGMCMNRAFDHRTPRRELREKLLVAMDRCQAEETSGGRRRRRIEPVAKGETTPAPES